jgi:hypothetical protein
MPKPGSTFSILSQSRRVSRFSQLGNVARGSARPAFIGSHRCRATFRNGRSNGSPPHLRTSGVDGPLIGPVQPGY